LIPQTIKRMTTYIFIQGVLPNGKAFRPSDWAERLVGAVATFCAPNPVSGPGGRMLACAAYSKWCFPTQVSGVTCVAIHPDLEKTHPAAFRFLVSFAQDNQLPITDVCPLVIPG
jgi:hypothetical protein